MKRAPPACRVLLAELPAAAPLESATLFAFDDHAFPFRRQARVHLNYAGAARRVLPAGTPGSHDEQTVYYGTTLRIGGRFHMWYAGCSGPQVNYAGRERSRWSICYATSADGVAWEKPDLGLVEFNGSRRNNIVDFPAAAEHNCAFALLHEPEDPDPARRFKMVFEAVTRDPVRRGKLGTAVYWGAAFSPDGLRWTLSPANPAGTSFEMSGLTRHRGLYYVNGHQPSWAHGPVRARRLCTFVSGDFERWSPVSAMGLDRAGDQTGPSTEADVNCHEEVHLGATLWNRGNVILGVFGLWHGHPSRDRRLVSMDLGLAVSHDAIHFREPVPGFPLVVAREQHGSVVGLAPALVQGQGMLNHGDRTLLWYSNWRGVEGNGVFMNSWPRDRLGMLKPFRLISGPPGCLDPGAPYAPRAVSTPVEVLDGRAPVRVNASGLGRHSRLRIGLLDRAFRPVPGFSGADAALVKADALAAPVRWPGGDALAKQLGPVRFDISFEGVRPEDACLHAVYVGAEEEDQGRLRRTRPRAF
jgi:hypothetical protein